MELIGEYLKSINMDSRFYYIDDKNEFSYFLENYKLPCILIKTNNNIELILDSSELNTMQHVDDLIDKLNILLAKY